VPWLILTLVLQFASGCGKKGPPLPPLRRGPDRITAVSARQEGRSVVVTGILPNKSQDGGPLAPIVEVRVFRLDRGGLSGVPGEKVKSFQRSALRQFTKDARRISVASGESLGRSLSGRRFVSVDPEPLTGLIPEGGKEFTYALTAVDAEKRSAPLSSFAAIRIFPPPLPPGNLKAELAEKSIHLFWEPPSPQAQNEGPLYNVYRSEKEGLFLDRPRNDRPLSQPLFEETDFVFGRDYYYVVRSVVASGSASRESENSSPLRVSPRDVYAPAAPTGFAVSAEGNVVKLYWFPNEESDLAGYRIYRSESESGGFTEIARVGNAETSYVDKAATAGVKYYYCVTAVDRADPSNESSRSEVRGDRLPSPNPPARKNKPGKP